MVTAGPLTAVVVHRRRPDPCERSRSICEWCGAPGTTRYGRTLVLTLCDECDGRFPDPADHRW